jgi:hypothetical protein
MINIKGIVAGAAIAVVAAFGAAVVPAGVASASTRPVVYQDMEWQGAHVAPHGIAEAFGADASIYLITTRWSHWAASSAHSTAGSIVWRACWYSCMTHKSAPATQSLYVARTHNGRRYFSRVRVEYRYHGVHVLVADYSRGTWVVVAGTRP